MSLSESTHTTPLVQYLTLAEAAKQLPRTNGRRIHTSTLWRWCRKGCNGIFLQYVRVGRNIMVTQESLLQFFTNLAKADSAPQDRQHTPTRRKRRPRPAQRHAAQNDAEAVLRRAKILV